MNREELYEFCKNRKERPMQEYDQRRPEGVTYQEWHDRLEFLACLQQAYTDETYYLDRETDIVYYSSYSIGD